MTPSLKEILLTEKRNLTIEYGCLMADIPKNYADRLVEFGKRIIDESELYKEGEEFGREEDMHCTVKYGFIKDLHELQIREILKNVKPFTIRVVGLGKFESKKFDVVKLTVKSDELNKLHEYCNKFPNKDEFPIYNSHITLGYIQKGIKKNFNKSLAMSIPISQFTYSPIYGEKSKFDLG